MGSSGRIEDIVIKELRVKKNLIQCIDGFSNCSTNSGMDEFNEKQIVNSYIVLMNCVGLSLGACFQKGLFALSDDAYTDLNGLLRDAIT